MLPPFADTATELIEKFGIDESLCRALAIISGHTKKIQQRSLLWAVEGYITVIMRVNMEITSVSYIWGILRRYFSPNLVEGVKGVKILNDKMGAAFDIPESLKDEMSEEILSTVNNRTFTVEFPTELPDLAEDDRSRMMGSQMGGMGQRGGYGNGMGNRGSRGGGYTGGYSNRGGNMNGGMGGGQGRRDYGEKPNHNKLFVGNLDFQTQDGALRQSFEGEGLSVVDSFIIKGSDS